MDPPPLPLPQPQPQPPWYVHVVSIFPCVNHGLLPRACFRPSTLRARKPYCRECVNRKERAKRDAR